MSAGKLAVFCPPFPAREFAPLKRFESAQRQYQGPHANVGFCPTRCPHLRQVIGVWMLQPVRIRCSIPSSSSRKLMSVGIDALLPPRPQPHDHFRKPGSLSVARRHSGNLINCPFSTFGLRHCSRATSSQPTLLAKSKQEITVEISPVHVFQYSSNRPSDHGRVKVNTLTSCWPTIHQNAAFGFRHHVTSGGQVRLRIVD
jgi:hypothetical protein